MCHWNTIFLRQIDLYRISMNLIQTQLLLRLFFLQLFWQ